MKHLSLIILAFLISLSINEYTFTSDKSGSTDCSDATNILVDFVDNDYLSDQESLDEIYNEMIKIPIIQSNLRKYKTDLPADYFTPTNLIDINATLAETPKTLSVIIEDLGQLLLWSNILRIKNPHLTHKQINAILTAVIMKSRYANDELDNETIKANLYTIMTYQAIYL